MVRASGKLVNTLDDKGNIIEYHRYNAVGTLTEHITNKYDVFNNPTEVKPYIGTRLLSPQTYQYVYDLNHNFTERSAYINGRLMSILQRVIYR